MVAVLNAAPRAAVPDAVAAWLDSLAPRFSPADRAALKDAFELAHARAADARMPEGEAALDRAVGAATILAALELDRDSVLAALLMPLAVADAFDAESVSAQFGADVATLVAGVSRMSSIRTNAAAAPGADSAVQAENLRKMLLAMVEDIRVVLVKLAERTQALRYLMGADETLRRETAREVLALFAPLANRLGVWQLKWELEDLSLRALEPDDYKRIARLLDERRLDRQRYIEDVIARLRAELAAAGVKADISGRPKHIYSIWSKLKRKQAGIEAIYDIRAVRIVVDSIKDCYTALGIVHHLWTPIPNEFDDYIAKPKANDYRSLHTAVIGPEDKALEVQVRTRVMHQHSEYGVAAHWRYKEAGVKETRQDPGFNARLGWLRQILDWKDAAADASELLAVFRSSLFTDSIFVLTPQGKAIDLPQGSTPIDFAYAVHTNLGHRCRGAKVDGQMVPLDYVLKNGQQVDILTTKQGGPSRDWLNPDLGYVHSHRARAKVRQWFKAQQLDETIAQGRAMVERELARQGQSAVKLETVAARAGFAKADELYAAFARDDINARQVQAAIHAVAQPGHADAAPAGEPVVIARKSKATSGSGGILVVGVDRLMTGLARCCKPAPPDAIVGFVTRGKGVTIHRLACSNVGRIRAREPERLIEANWGDAHEDVFPVDIVVEAMDRQGLLRDISEIMTRERINVTAVNTLSKNLQARMSFTLEVQSVAQLKRALLLLRDVRGVVGAARR
ncbi:MAG: GTP diphosphokinase [Casimicrobiaceae bacterium]